MAETYKNKAHNELVINIAGLNRTIRFKTGGDLADPRTSTAYRFNGVLNGGIYEAFTVEGTAQLSKSMADFLSRAFVEGQLAKSTSAIYRQYLTVDGGVVREAKFGNCRLSSPPSVNISEDGGGDGFDVQLSFSLNDLIEDSWKSEDN